MDKVKLTKERIKTSEPSHIIASGILYDLPDGVLPFLPTDLLKFVIVRGAVPDWACYVDYCYKTKQDVRELGFKVHDKEILSKFVEFDDEVWEMYRH